MAISMLRSLGCADDLSWYSTNDHSGSWGTHKITQKDQPSTSHVLDI